MKIAHLINLSRVGGIERSYSQLINFKYKIDGETITHHTIQTRNNLSHILEKCIQDGSASIHHFKYYKSLKLPRRPIVLRNYNQKRIFSSIRPDIIVLWSNPKSIKYAEISPETRLVYYEHGASWFNKDDAAMEELFKKVSGIICNSFAAKRMLELKWGIDPDKEIKVCLNAIRPDCLPASFKTKKLNKDKPFQLGIAGRLVSIKGIPLVIHALFELKRRKIPCELFVAGTGHELENLKALTFRLNLQSEVKFLGLVGDMSSFFNWIDCFVCPSIRESFGLVCAEAMAYGCPVIAAKVDGLPEVVSHMKTGFCLAPVLPIEDYAALGGSMANLPEKIYNPESDNIECPKLLDPQAIADSIENLYFNSDLYSKMSSFAIEDAQRKFNFNTHAKQVLAFLKDMCEVK